MAPTDKDIYQKEKAIRFCLATGLIPYYEVNISNARELADSPEWLTDIDVLGVRAGRAGVVRVLFDCKTQKTSPINRAFWAAGLMQYIGAEEAFVILKREAGQGHKLSAKTFGVHLFDEILFDNYANSLSPTYREVIAYASKIEHWNFLHDVFRKNTTLIKLGLHLRHFVPLEMDAAKALRGTVSNLMQIRGELDPARNEHMAIYSYSLFSFTFSCSPIVRDFFDVFDPKLPKEEFEKLLRLYVWGGREAYQLRKKVYELMASKNEHVMNDSELSGWDVFVEMIRSFLDAPDEVQNCCVPLIDLSIRYLCKPDEKSEKFITHIFSRSNRVRQFIFRLSSYLVSATGLPKEFDVRLREDINFILRDDRV